MSATSTPSTPIRLRRAVALLALIIGACASLARVAPAQRKNDPKECPYCHGDPAIMAKAGIVSHGGFEFGSTDTGKVDALLATNDIRWIESKHFELGFALGSIKVKQEDKAKIRGELARLAAVLDGIDVKIAVLDPWLRAHLFAQRLEDMYQRFSDLMQVKDSDFPDGTKLYDMHGKYMGTGPYLGEKGKYEVLVVPTEASLSQYLQTHFGLLTKKTQRWNLPDRDSLSVTINGGDDNTREDEALHGHLAFNVTINLLDGFKHYSYDTPIWIREGLAHFCEREITKKYNSFDSSEGGIAETTRKERWEPEVRKLVQGEKQPRMAELIGMKDYNELTLPRHFTTWSMIDYLLKTNPSGFAKFNDALHGILNAKGIPDSANLPDVHREKFKECLGMTYAEFDAKWAEWVLATYGAQ
jgi:hypothetical protein